jgi:hypothetical protein
MYAQAQACPEKSEARLLFAETEKIAINRGDGDSFIAGRQGSQAQNRAQLIAYIPYFSQKAGP